MLEQVTVSNFVQDQGTISGAGRKVDVALVGVLRCVLLFVLGVLVAPRVVIALQAQ